MSKNLITVPGHVYVWRDKWIAVPQDTIDCLTDNGVTIHILFRKGYAPGIRNTGRHGSQHCVTITDPCKNFNQNHCDTFRYIKQGCSRGSKFTSSPKRQSFAKTGGHKGKHTEVHTTEVHVSEALPVASHFHAESSSSSSTDSHEESVASPGRAERNTFAGIIFDDTLDKVKSRSKQISVKKINHDVSIPTAQDD